MSGNQKFAYYRPESVSELSDCLRTVPPEGRFFLAGGTDLWVDVARGKKKAAAVVDLKCIQELAGWREEDDRVFIGALTKIHDIEADKALEFRYPALTEAASALGSLQVRNRATLGGNASNAAPTADTSIALSALKAQAVLLKDNQTRTVPISEFFLGAGRTCLAENEILMGFSLKKNVGKSCFLKQGPRRAMDIAILSAAAALDLTTDGVIADAGLALGGAASVPLRCTEAEHYLIGKTPDPIVLREAGEISAAHSNPRDSNRASREYRLGLIPVMIERALAAAVRRNEEERA